MIDRQSRLSLSHRESSKNLIKNKKMLIKKNHRGLS